MVHGQDVSPDSQGVGESHQEVQTQEGADLRQVRQGLPHPLQMLRRDYR